ncbi:MAG: ABC transporter ATP-binding protein [Alphaproteobacteria bacterium]|nr:ABC transporter ATP-binding protein [Alphaproteobacteria bacterium]
MTLLAVRALARAFGGVRAVDGVDFDVAAGRLTALIGPNGAGKTTCFNLLNGQLRPDAGSVSLDGQELVGRAPRTIARLGVGRTFQIAATFASMDVRENVQVALLAHRRQITRLWGQARGSHAGDADRLLEQVGLADQKDRPAGVLAYGDVKRLELAMALAGEPRLLLMDEPTAGMAPAERAGLMRLISAIVRERGLGVLFTEHDMDVVFRAADNILVMDRGRLIAEGPPEAVRANPTVRAVYLGGE